MEEDHEKGQLFHESLERIEDITVFWTNERRHDTSKPLEGEYFEVAGVPTYFIRFQRLGVFETPNYESIKVVEERIAHVEINLAGQKLFGRFLPISTSSGKDIARVVRDSWLSDLLDGIDLNLENS